MDRLTRLHMRAVENYREGTSHRWVACLIANRISGSYTPDAMKNLAHDLRIGKSQVYNLAKAGYTYLVLRKVCKELPEYRRQLTTTHFTVLGEAMISYDIPVWEAIEQIKTAATEGASVKTMSAALAGEYGGREVKPWPHKLAILYTHASKLIEDYSLPDDVRDILTEFRRLIGPWLPEEDPHDRW